MKKSEILESLAGHLDTRRLIAETPGLDEKALRVLLREAAAALGPAEALFKGQRQGTLPGMDEGCGAGQVAKVKKGGRLMLFTDGASRGNPGEAGAGAVLKDSRGNVVSRVARYLGLATNNQAEYTALIEGIGAAIKLGADELEVHADSELVVKQVRGEYKVKNPALKEMHHRAVTLLKGFRRVEVRYIPRAENSEADALANEAIDKKLGCK